MRKYSMSHKGNQKIVHIKIHAKPSSKKEIVTKISNDRYDISVKESAENNCANKRILEIVHSLYPKSVVRIVSGHHSSSKMVSVETSMI